MTLEKAIAEAAAEGLIEIVPAPLTVEIHITIPSTAPTALLERVEAYAAELGRSDLVDVVEVEIIRTCSVCGCTDDQACFGGCEWVNDESEQPDLCSSCVEAPDADA